MKWLYKIFTVCVFLFPYNMYADSGEAPQDAKTISNNPYDIYLDKLEAIVIEREIADDKIKNGNQEEGFEELKTNNKKLDELGFIPWPKLNQEQSARAQELARRLDKAMRKLLGQE